MIAKESWNVYPSCSIFWEYGINRGGKYWESRSTIPDKLITTRAPVTQWHFTWACSLALLWHSQVVINSHNPSKKDDMEHKSFLHPVLCLCHWSLHPSWHNSQPGKGSLQDGFPKRQASQLLDAAGPFWTDVVRRRALAWLLVLWGKLQAVYIKSRPAWKAFKQKWNVPFWQEAQRKISTFWLDLFSLLSWCLFSSNFG